MKLKNKAAPATEEQGARGKSARADRPPGWLAVPALAAMTIVYALPLAVLLAHSVTDPSLGLGNFTRIFRHTGYLITIARTFGIAGTATLLALLIGYPLAYVIATDSRRWLVRTLTFCVLAPYVTSLLVRSFAWQVLLGRVGPLNRALQALGFAPHDLLFTQAAVLIGLTHFVLPMMVLPLASVMRGVDPSLRRAAASLGAGPLSAFVRVFVPAAMPGVQTGVALCFIYGIGAFVIPALLGGNNGRMLGALVQSAIEQQADYGLAAAAAVLLAVSVCVVAWLLRRSVTGSHGMPGVQPAPQARAATTYRHGWLGLTLTAWAARPAAALDRSRLSRMSWLVTLIAAIAAGFSFLPQLVAIPLSFSSSRTLVFPPPGWSLQWYRSFLSPDWSVPLLNSIGIGLATAVLATLLGSLAAFGVVRGLGPGTAALARLVLVLPMLFPTIVAGTALYITYLPLHLDDTRIGIVLAHTAIALPFVFIVAAGHLGTLDRRYEHAAASLGARPLTVLRRIVLPLVGRSLQTAAFFAFVTSFDEATVAILLSGLDVKTLPRRMYEALAWESDPTVAVVAVVAMSVTALAMALPTLTGHLPALMRRRAPRGQRNASAWQRATDTAS
jgi:putative spermidine/putrescine transport system permease protein